MTIYGIKQLKAYFLPLTLFLAIILGGLNRLSHRPQKAKLLKPLGDVFLKSTFYYPFH